MGIGSPLQINISFLMLFWAEAGVSSPSSDSSDSSSLSGLMTLISFIIYCASRESLCTWNILLTMVLGVSWSCPLGYYYAAIDSIYSWYDMGLRLPRELFLRAGFLTEFSFSIYLYSSCCYRRAFFTLSPNALFSSGASIFYGLVLSRDEYLKY